MPLYKEQGIVLRSIKLGEADKIVTILTQGSGKVRAVAKGIRRTTSRFGARLEPFTHVSLLLYRGRGSSTPSPRPRSSPRSGRCRTTSRCIAAGETMLEAVDKVAEEHERNVRLFLLLLSGLRALEAGPADPAAVAESLPPEAPVALRVPPQPLRVRGLRRPGPHDCSPPGRAGWCAAAAPSTGAGRVAADALALLQRWRSPGWTAGRA